MATVADPAAPAVIPVADPTTAPVAAPVADPVADAPDPSAGTRPGDGFGVSVTVLHTVTDYRNVANAARAEGHTIGVVPTMGALHAGHRSLIERAARECGVVVVTVFVNPTQFGDAADLANYPRTFGADLEVVSAAGGAFVFLPSVEEMYPDGLRSDPIPSGVAGLSRVLEGDSRPGHFDGVATVVPRLLAPAGPCRAYFGEKDFQQLALVRRLVRDLGLPVEVVGCTTVRDTDGLALSSRNVRLSPDERRVSLALPRALRAGAEAIADGVADGAQVARSMEAVVGAEPLVVLDYAAVVQADTFEPVAHWDDRTSLRLLIAARVGPVRLIDNLDPRHPLPSAPAVGLDPVR